MRRDPLEREHVTLFFERHPERFDLLGVEPPARHHRPDLRVTLDTPEDYEVLSAVYDALYKAIPSFDLDAVIAFSTPSGDRRTQSPCAPGDSVTRAATASALLTDLPDQLERLGGFEARL